MCNIQKTFPLRKARSTYSLPEGMRQTSRNDFINEIYKNSSNYSLCLKSDESSKNCKRTYSFITKYKNNCKTMNLQPLSLIKVQFSDFFLDLIVDRIKLSDWIVLLKTISRDKSLHFISFQSKIRGHVIQEHINTEKKAQQVNKGSVLYTRYLINKVAESLGECLSHSKNFLCLQLQRIPLRGGGIQILGEGLKKTQCLQHLSLQHCDIGDEGCYVLSYALRNVPTLLTLDISFSNISTAGAKHISELIKFQEIVRFGECWKQSLRYREVNHDQIQGLRRVTLNDNPDIGDTGLQYIADVLMDDFWVRALDMQNCGITEDGASLVKKLIEINNEIGVIDLRRNPQMKKITIANIIKALNEKITEEKAEYVWLQLNNQTQPRSVISTVNSYENNIWNRGTRISSSTLVSSKEQKSVTKVKKWKESSQKILLKEEENSFCPPQHPELKEEENSFCPPQHPEDYKDYKKGLKDEFSSSDEIERSSCKSIKTDSCKSVKSGSCKSVKTESCTSVKADSCKSVKVGSCNSVKTGFCKSVETTSCDDAHSDLKDKECTDSDLTNNIKEIFYEFIKSSEKNRKIYPNVNYQRRKYDRLIAMDLK